MRQIQPDAKAEQIRIANTGSALRNLRHAVTQIGIMARLWNAGVQ
jgi:hypothetical protein